MMIEVVKSKQIGGNNNKTVLKVARVSNRNNWLNSWSSSDVSSLPRCLAHGRVRCPVHCPPHCPKHDLAHGPAHGSKLDPAHGPAHGSKLDPAHGPAHGSKHGPADDSAQCLTLISLSGTWFGAQFWARPLSLVTRRNGGTPRPLCVHSGLGTPPLFRPPLWRSAVVSGLRGCFEQAFGSRRGSGSGTRSNSRGREARHQGRKGKCGAVAR